MWQAPNTTVQKHERQNLFKEIKESNVTPSAVASGAGSDVVKVRRAPARTNVRAYSLLLLQTLEDALKAAETSLRMVDATKKSVASNERNLDDSKNNVVGCDRA